MSAFFKIPLQALMLLTGVLVFVLLPVPAAADAVQPGARGEDRAERRARRSIQRSRREFAAAFEARRAAAAALADAGDGATEQRRARRSHATDASVKAIRARAAQLVREVTGDERYKRSHRRHARARRQLRVSDVRDDAAADRARRADHRGDLRGRDVEHRRGAELAGDVDASSTSTGGMLKPTATDAHYLTVSKLLTGFWGVFACVVAIYAAGLGSLIEVVNRFGSFFYGSLLGVFVLALGFKRATGTGAFVGLHRRHGGGGGGRVSPGDQRHLVSLAQPDRRRSSSSSSACWSA